MADVFFRDPYTRLTLLQLFCYGFLSLPIAMGGFVLVTYIPTFYAIDLGLGLGLVGAVFVFGRLLDVLTDPIIGYMSDITRTRLGRRRPWMIIGMPLFCLACWWLFIPPETVNLTYLAVSSIAYFLFYTVLDVPYSSTGLEISPYIHERSILASTKAVFQVLGALLAALIPSIFMWEIAGSLGFITKVICGLSLIGVLVFLACVPIRENSLTMASPSFSRSVKTVWSHRSYRYIISAFTSVQTANALIAALTVLFVTHIIGTPKLVGMFLGVLLISSAVFLPVWVWVSKRTSKKRAWASSIFLCTLVLGTIPILGEGDVVPVLIFCIAIGATFGCDAIMPTSMLADIVYRDEKQGQENMASLYLAFKNSVSKLTFIVPMGLAFPVLDFTGFSSGSDAAPHRLGVFIFFYAGLPILLRLISLAIVLKMPETERHQA